MNTMKQYEVRIEGLTPLLMHRDNVIFGEKVRAWQKDPANKGQSTAGDDRSPAWIWVGYTYHDNRHLIMPSDNLMTMLREAGAKVTRKGKETFKKYTQSGVMIDGEGFDLLIGGEAVEIKPFNALIGNNDFAAHVEAAESAGFELLVKRAAVNRAKTLRVRPMFRQWELTGSLTVLDEEQSGLTAAVLTQVFNIGGSLCGLGDWRPSSGASGTFGRFRAEVRKV
jgi:hypothetical protein